MNEAAKTPRLGCSSLALVGALALLVVVALQRQPEPPSWSATGAAAIAVVAVFLLTRAVQNIFWGLLAATLLTCHPWWQEPHDSQAVEVLAGALVLAVVAVTGLGWQLAFQPQLALRAWPLLLGVLAVCIGLAWKGQPTLGILAAGISGTGLLLASFLASRQREQNSPGSPATLNVLAAGVLGVLAPLAGLLVFRFFDRTLFAAQGWWPLVRDAFPGSLEINTSGFSAAATASWPHPWLTLPLAGWSLINLARRGRRQWREGQAPTGWYVAAATALCGAGLLVAPAEPGQGMPLVLTSLSVLLVTVLLADLLGNAFDRLVLHPPEEAASRSPLHAVPARTPEQTR